MLLEELQKLDLNQKEATIYLTALELGPATLLELSKKSKLNRVTLYDITQKLIDKKLMFISIKGKKKIFTAQAPEKIKGLLKEKIDILGSILPELNSLIDKTKARPKIKYLEGIEGIKESYRESLKTQDDIILGFLGFEALISESKVLNNFWDKEYIPKRKKLKKFAQVVSPDNQTGKDRKKDDKRDYRETKLVPASFYNFKCDLFIYDNKITAVSYSQGEEFALIVESGPISETLKMIWKMCWNMGY